MVLSVLGHPLSGFFWKCETSVRLWKLSSMLSVSKNPSTLSVMVWLGNVSHGIVFGMCRPCLVFLSRKTVDSLWGGPYLWKQVCRHGDLKAITWPLALDTLCPCLSCCDMQLPLTALTALTSKPRGTKLSKTMNQNKSFFLKKKKFCQTFCHSNTREAKTLSNIPIYSSIPDTGPMLFLGFERYQLANCHLKGPHTCLSLDIF